MSDQRESTQTVHERCRIEALTLRRTGELYCCVPEWKVKRFRGLQLPRQHEEWNTKASTLRFTKTFRAKLLRVTFKREGSALKDVFWSGSLQMLIKWHSPPPHTQPPSWWWCWRPKCPSLRQEKNTRLFPLPRGVSGDLIRRLSSCLRGEEKAFRAVRLVASRWGCGALVLEKGGKTRDHKISYEKDFFFFLRQTNHPA